jgi:tetratricopeptide (TPR) repeat protein
MINYMLLAAIALLSCTALAQPVPAADFASQRDAAMALRKEGKLAEARQAYEQVLASEGITPDQTAQILLDLSDSYCQEYKWMPARQALDRALATTGVSGTVQAKIHLAIATTYVRTGHWDKVIAPSRAALAITEASPADQLAARQMLAKAHMNLRQFAEARAVMRQLLEQGEVAGPSVEQAAPNTVLPEYLAARLLPAAERATMQIAIGKTLFLEQQYAEARAEFAKAQAMPGANNPMKAEVQLYIGLTYYEENDNDRAREELLKVTRMPDSGTRAPWDGGRMAYVPNREALLRLHFRNLTASTDKPLKVLFIGSSHTLRENMPELVTQLAASAPADRPRILAGDYVYMGTNIITFWNAGDGPQTARGVIAAEPWDVVVFEAFYNVKAAEMAQYGGQFVDVIRKRGARPVIYESPLPKAQPYPDRFMQFHNETMAAATALRVPVGPGVLAWMRRLGDQPTEAQFAEVYADWIHAAPRGAYLNACCLYAAITGASPVGLYHPANMSAEDAATLQQIAWQAYQDANKELSPSP